MYPGYPQTWGLTTVSVLYTEEWQGNLGIIDALLNEAITQSIAVYSPLTAPPDLVIILGATHENDTALNAVFPSFPDGPCQIKSFENWVADEAIVMSPTAMQAVAHEIYHCVQQKMIGTTTIAKSPTNWVIEGSADYFSNVVYPYVNREWASSAAYNPNIPIFGQTYEASLFFQALEGQRGIAYLHQFVVSTTYSATADEERARLASIPGFADDFWLFAKAFSVADIYDTDGEYFPINNLPEVRGMIWSVNEDETQGTAYLEFEPFTIPVYRTSFDPGQTVQIYSNAKGNQRVAWRRRGEAFWSELPTSGFSGGSQGVIEIPCASGPQVVYFLAISTEDKGSEKIQIDFVQTHKDENCCKKKGKGKRAELKECPTSSANPTSDVPEPTSTGSGSCAGSDIDMDPCLVGKKWSLDIPSTRELVKKQFDGIPDFTLNSIGVSGGGGLNFGDDTAKFTYTGLKIDLDITSAGMNLPISVTINGEAAGKFFIKEGGSGSGRACLTYVSGKGTATAQVPFIGEQVFDLAPGGGYLADMDIDYTCSGNKLTIKSAQAQVPGGATWGPFAYNA